MKHRSFPLQSKAHPIGKHQFSHSNPRARSRRRQNFLNHEVTAQPGPWITVKTAPSPTSTCFSGRSRCRLFPGIANFSKCARHRKHQFSHREIRKQARSEAQVFPTSKSTPHRQAPVFPFKSTCISRVKPLQALCVFPFKSTTREQMTSSKAFSHREIRKQARRTFSITK